MTSSAPNPDFAAFAQYAAMVATAIAVAVVAAVAALRRMAPSDRPRSPFSGQPVNDQQFAQMMFSAQEVTARELRRVVEHLQDLRGDLRDRIERFEEIRRTVELNTRTLGEIADDIDVLRRRARSSRGDE